jgi:hypothetical protein
LKQIEIDHSRQRGFVFESEIAILSAWHGFPCVSVPIDSLYLHDGRPSHFEPVADITKIVLMVAWKIISKGLNIPGLWRVLLNKPIPVASYP